MDIFMLIFRQIGEMRAKRLTFLHILGHTLSIYFIKDEL